MTPPVPEPTLSRLGREALMYAGIEWPVFPLRPKGKQPLTEHGVKDATTDPKQIEAWWRECPDANIGVACGVDLQYDPKLGRVVRAANNSVLDVDQKPWADKHGEDTLRQVLESHGPFPMTVIQRTWSGGRQFIFRYHHDASSAAHAYGQHLDGRNNGTYIVVPPSVVEEAGRRGTYEWTVSPLAYTPAAMPDWLVALGRSGKATKPKDWSDAKLHGVKLGTQDQDLLSLLGRYAAMRPPLSQDEVLTILLAIGATYEPPADPEKIREKVSRLFETYASGALLRYERTDTGNAERLVTLYGDHFRYVLTERAWRAWDGQRWAIGNVEQVRHYAVLSTRHLQANAVRTEAGDEKERLVKFAVASEDARAISRCVQQAQSQRAVWAKGSDFDQNPDLLNVANGTLDLATFRLRPHEPADHLSLITPVAYEPDATCPHWLSFLKDVFLGRQELIDHVQECVGYTLTGSIQEQCLFFLYGGGDNGKSTFVEVVTALLGEYAVKVSADTILASTDPKHSGKPVPELLALVGKRFAFIDELNQERQLDEARVKAMTGSHRETARQLYKGQVEWDNTHKLWFDLNVLPAFKGVDDGIRRRPRVLPFDWKVPEAAKDPRLARDRLLPELPGILAWAVEGCRRWRTRGRLVPPLAVQLATREYVDAQNHLPVWFEEVYTLALDYPLQGQAIQETYRAWCQRHGEVPKDYQRGVVPYLKTVARLRHQRSKTGGVWFGARPKE